jgi:murein DD-endopeptidase MepM/ murein hydrolase activator NlpD
LTQKPHSHYRWQLLIFVSVPFTVSQSADRPKASTTHPRPAHFRWLAGALLLPLVGGCAAYYLLSRQTSTLPSELNSLANDVTPELSLPSQSPDASQTLTHTVEFVVRRNDTMERIFRQLELDLNDLAAIRELPGVDRTLDMLKPGDPITFTHGSDGSVQSLSRQVDATSRLEVTRDGDTFHAQLVATPVTIRTTTIHGTVESSLFASAHKAGLSSDLIMRLANDIFGWDIDFALDIRRGDSFNVVYEQQYRDGQYVGDGKILAAEFINDGKTYRAIRYDSADGKIGNYFTPDGRSMHKQFLRAPVDFTRISSGFSLARFHPILNKMRAHKGVDYAAPTGTPIKASGDGKVQFAGQQHGYGNVIILDHGAGITTLYGHMSRFGTFRAGARVKQGDIIGYVGMTGLATGPHLHYEYRINGVYKDPRSVPLPNAAPIPSEYMVDFRAKAGTLLAALNPEPPATTRIAQATH